MYKDREKQKQANREANKRYRKKGITQGITEGQGITGGITDIPDFARVLPQDRINRIQAILRERARVGLFDDSQERWERAVGYLKWEQSGRPMSIPEKLVTQRNSLEAIVDACNGRKDILDGIRVGVDGPNLSLITELLEVTG